MEITMREIYSEWSLQRINLASYFRVLFEFLTKVFKLGSMSFILCLSLDMVTSIYAAKKTEMRMFGYTTRMTEGSPFCEQLQKTK